MKKTILSVQVDLPCLYYIGADFNHSPLWWCSNCGDSGLIEICHPSTDGLIGWRDCGCIPPPVYKYYQWKKSEAERKMSKLDDCPF